MQTSFPKDTNSKEDIDEIREALKALKIPFQETEEEIILLGNDKEQFQAITKLKKYLKAKEISKTNQECNQICYRLAYYLADFSKIQEAKIKGGKKGKRIVVKGLDLYGHKRTEIIFMEGLEKCHKEVQDYLNWIVKEDAEGAKELGSKQQPDPKQKRTPKFGDLQ